MDIRFTMSSERAPINRTIAECFGYGRHFEQFRPVNECLDPVLSEKKWLPFVGDYRTFLNSSGISAELFCALGRI